MRAVTTIEGSRARSQGRDRVAWHTATDWKRQFRHDKLIVTVPAFPPGTLVVRPSTPGMGDLLDAFKGKGLTTLQKNRLVGSVYTGVVKVRDRQMKAGELRIRNFRTGQ